MPRLDSGLIVLEDEFYVVMKSSRNDGYTKLCGGARSWFVLDRVIIEDAGNVVPVGKLQWSGWIHVGDSINSISKLAVYICH